MGLKIYQLDTLLDIEGWGGNEVPYLGYVEARLQVKEISGMNEDSLFLVVPDSNYTRRVPISIGTVHIERCLQLLKKEEIPNLTRPWERAIFPKRILNKEKIVEPDFNLDSVEGKVKLSKSVVLKPFETVLVSGISESRQHRKRVNVMIDRMEGSLGDDVVPANSYSILYPGSTRAKVALRNMTPKKIVLKAKTCVAKMAAANVVPHMLAPKIVKGSGNKAQTESVVNEGEEVKLTPLTPEQQKKLNSKLDLTGTENWSQEDKKAVEELFKEYGRLFALEKNDLGHTTKVKHKIRLNDYTPFKERYRRVPPHLYEEVRRHLKEMVEIGAIRKSNSPWASAVVLVRKKDGSLRFCIDLRHLNNRTIKDAYSLPRIEETLDCLNGAKIFTSLDLKSGYWQVEMEEESKPLTAFTVGPLGFFECERMPFGLTNAPATFQRLMENCLGDLHLNWCIIYLDDIIVFSETPKEHIKRLRGVFQKLASAGLKLKPNKCEFFKKKITYLGYVVSEEGIEVDPKKTEAVKNWPVPKTVTDVRSFLGFTNQYRKFIPKYAHVAGPLNGLISGDNSKKKKREVQWTSECQEAFETLKEHCCTTPVLAYADYKRPFRLHTDASDLGLGAVLYQQDENGKNKVIAYASRTLNQAEKNYPAHKLEFLALKWAVTSRFHEYLYGGEFAVYTDNNPLTYVLSMAKLDATGQRWIAALANYNFSLHYKSGKTNIEADALSRIPNREGEISIDKDAVQAIANAMQIGEFSELNENPNLIVCKSAVPTPKKFSNEDWVREQTQDPDIGQFIQLLKGNKVESLTDDVSIMKRKRGRYILRNGLLYKKCVSNNRETGYLQFVLPKLFRKQALEACHDEIGHLGIERTTSLLKDRFYWPKMENDIEEYVKTCPRCLKFKAIPERAELNIIDVTRPLELVHIDFLTIEAPKKDKDVNILVVTDHFTRYAQAYVTRSQTAPIVASTLWEKFFVHYGFPEKILSDQGRNFESNLIAELCKLVQIKKLRTTPYRPEGNGSCERFNRTLISMIGTLPEELKVHWPQHVSTLTHAYNCTRNNATGFSPYFLMYGRQPLLPIDIEYGVFTPDVTGVATQKYVQMLKHRLEWAYNKAREVSAKEAKRSKRRYDRKVRCSKLDIGDIVLVRQKGFTGKHKVADRWEKDYYEVISQKSSGIPVFVVKSLGKNKRERTLHRNMLYPLSFQVQSEPEQYDDVDCESLVENQSKSIDDSLVDQPIQQGPMTHSRTQALMKANLLMSEHFDIDNSFCPDETV